MRCTSTRLPANWQPETQGRFHLQHCPILGVHFYPQVRFNKALEELGDAKTELDRFYALDKLVMLSNGIEDVLPLKKHGLKLLEMAERNQSNRNYGNAIHHGNILLGRIALLEGKLEEAKQYLLLAGKTVGSPQLNSFGPNMLLAKELLQRGEKTTVLHYLELCRSFWKLGSGELEYWEHKIENDIVPDFGANLFY